MFVTIATKDTSVFMKNEDAAAASPKCASARHTVGAFAHRRAAEWQQIRRRAAAAFNEWRRMPLAFASL
jgi:hypothetical protein